MKKNIEFIENFGIHLSKALNSIKHTPESFANTHSLELEKIINVINGIDKPDQHLLNVLEDHRIINFSDFLKTDEPNKLINQTKEKINLKFSSQNSLRTTRTFSRGPSNNKFEYYHYSDLAASKFSNILPEHIVPIQETEALLNEYGEIPNWAFNKGHLEHQITYFAGKIDFHWIQNGKKYTREMKDGEMNYIFPYTPHTFTTRNYGSYIAAVTYKSVLSSSIGIELINNMQKVKSLSIFESINSISTDSQDIKEYIKFSPSIKNRNEWNLSDKSLSPFIKYNSNILKGDAEINQRWTYCISPPLELKSKSKLDTNYCKIIGDSFISTDDRNSNYEYDFKEEYIQIGLNNPIQISKNFIIKEAINLVEMHGLDALHRLISDNAAWF